MKNTNPTHLLINKDTLKVLLPGARLKTFRNEPVVLQGGRVGFHDGSTGRIHVSSPDGLRQDSYYPSVCNCKWTTDEQYVDALVAGGMAEEQAEEVLAEILHALGHKPY